MRLLYGTRNPAKLAMMREAVSNLGIEILCLSDLAGTPPTVVEEGSSPLENARLKARAYFAWAGIPAFSCDSGLFIDGIMEDEQPGVHVRNVGGRRLTDDEMIRYYAGIAGRMGGVCTARYRNAICLIRSDGAAMESDAPELAGEQFLLLDHPHPVRREGFPLDSLSADPASGRYFYDETRQGTMFTHDGFQRFFRTALPFLEGTQ